MKLALLLPNNVYYCPYSSIYSNLLDDWNVEYDVICWDKMGIVDNADFIYHKNVNASDLLLKKMYYYFKFACFLRQRIKQEKYDKLIVFTPQVAIFLYPFLNKYYQNKFILDYRDLSIEQKMMKIYRKVLSISSYNVISSPDFRKYLPKEFDYIISHNINESLVKKSLSMKFINRKVGDLCILTIGAIRDLEQNIELMNALANRQGFQMNFVGKSDLSDSIKDYAWKHGVLNANFSGFYLKEEEVKYIESSSFMNIYYPRKKSHDTALSNRFYNALIFCKPMIVTKNTIQGNWAEKYGVGIAIDNCVGLADKLLRYHAQFDVDRYMKGRNLLLSNILRQHEDFKLCVENFVEQY